LANVDVMQDERLPENSAARGAQLMDALRPLEDELPLVGELRGKGLMIGLELVRDADKTPAVDAAKEVKKRCREAGMLIGVGGTYANVVRLQPPLVLNEDEAVQIIDTLSKILRDVNGSL
jgi:4-aminobutyrate aminotransferase-like enzyme